VLMQGVTRCAKTKGDVCSHIDARLTNTSTCQLLCTRAHQHEKKQNSTNYTGQLIFARPCHHSAHSELPAMMASLSSADPQPSAASMVGAGNPDLILDCLDIALVSSPSGARGIVADASASIIVVDASGRLFDFRSLAVAVFSKILLWEPFLLRGFLCSGAFVAIRCTCLAVTARLYINKSQIRDDLKWQEQVHICRAELRAQTAQWHAEGRVEPTYFPFESDSDDD